jgi:hypothetical protein
MITFPLANFLIACQVGVEYLCLGVVYRNNLMAQFVNDFWVWTLNGSWKCVTALKYQVLMERRRVQQPKLHGLP